MPSFPAPRSAGPFGALLPDRRDAGWLLGYAVAFALSHHVAAIWGGQGYYSLLYPAAGVRLALLWRRGPRLTLAVALTELVVQGLNGIVVPGAPGWIVVASGVVRPPIAYGAVVWLVRRLTTRATAGAATSSLATAPMPLSLAAIGAPVAAVLAALPYAIWLPELTGVRGLLPLIASLTAFAVGDVLGVLLIAPPILWLVEATQTPAPHRIRHPIAAWGEAGSVLLLAIVVSVALVRTGLGLPPTPTLLAVAWIGLRFGRKAGWCAIVLVTALVLPLTTASVPLPDRLALHMSLASIAVVGYLAGSFADAQARARADLARRDRMLFQAERLKTLRAMSVAVIHEISQPLSTLAIEARHLHALTAATPGEVADTAALIDRKAAALSTLVRRLRRFGGRAVDQPSALPVRALIATVAAIVEPEARAARSDLTIGAIDPDWIVTGQEVELAQAIVNLVRNALQAGDGPVALSVAADADTVHLTIANRCPQHPASHDGMGVGTLIAQAIVAAHGGTLTRWTDADSMVRATLTLPRTGAAT